MWHCLMGNVRSCLSCFDCECRVCVLVQAKPKGVMKLGGYRVNEDPNNNEMERVKRVLKSLNVEEEVAHPRDDILP